MGAAAARRRSPDRFRSRVRRHPLPARHRRRSCRGHRRHRRRCPRRQTHPPSIRWLPTSPCRRLEPGAPHPMIATTHPTTLAVNLLDAHSLISTFGTVGIAAILFAETGLLLGLFLPGDSLLFTAGVLCATRTTSTTHLTLGWVLVAAALGALIGAQTGYGIGRLAGPRMFQRADRPRLTAATARTAAFLERYGTGKALVLARFVPLVRTAINP